MHAVLPPAVVEGSCGPDSMESIVARAIPLQIVVTPAPHSVPAAVKRAPSHAPKAPPAPPLPVRAMAARRSMRK
ncbi:hypothetical protein PG995_009080 [Apiospora arundinis]